MGAHDPIRCFHLHEAAERGFAYAQATCADGLLYVAAHGAGFPDVLKETVFVTDMDAMLAANGERAAAYGAHTPACTVVEIRRLAFPACMAEIELVARLPR
jgi:hypothetical protein